MFSIHDDNDDNDNDDSDDDDFDDDDHDDANDDDDEKKDDTCHKRASEGILQTTSWIATQVCQC